MSGYKDFGEGVCNMIGCALTACVLLAPLAAWKIVDIIIWVIGNL